MVSYAYLEYVSQMQNRLEKYLTSEINLFEKSPALTHKSLDALFDGPKNLSGILTDVAEEIKNREKKAEKKGYERAVADMNKAAKERVEKYIYNISFIVGLIHKVASDEIKNFKIVDSRARFSFDTEWIDLAFVIDSEFEDEILFSSVLNRIQNSVFSNQKRIIEIIQVNQKNKELDHSVLKSDYPFIVKPAEIKA